MRFKDFYEYSSDGLFLGIYTAQKDIKEEHYLLGNGIYTDIKIPTYNSENEFLIFKNNEWQIKNQISIGLYFNIETLEKLEITKFNRELIHLSIESFETKFTSVEPPVYNNGDKLKFNLDSKIWEILEIGEITKNKNLRILKNKKLEECKQFYNDLRYFSIQNETYKIQFVAAENDRFSKTGSRIFGSKSIENALSQIRGKSEAHAVPKESLFFPYVISSATAIQVPYLKLSEISYKVGEQRTKCAILEGIHTFIIESITLEEHLFSYDYKLDILPQSTGGEASSIEDIIL